MRKIWVVLGALAVLALPAAANGDPSPASGSEEIRDYRSQVVVSADATMRVTETITYDFGSTVHHGIFRYIPTRVPYDDQHDRVYPVSGVSVTVDNGQSVPVDQSTMDGNLVLKIGDPDVTITGTHSYLIAYTVAGALNHFADHDELYWNVIGSDWPVGIAQASATVRGPAPITRVACYSGAPQSRLGCDQATIDSGVATFRQANLDAGAGMTVVAAFPPGAVSTVEPILVERHDLGTAFRPSPVAVGVGSGLALLGIALVLWVVWRRGRDRRFVGLLPGLTPEPGESAVEERKPLIGAPAVTVEFGPPDKLRPGQVGTLIDERADVVDVTATIVDLAVRRYLGIDEVRPDPDRAPVDWHLTRLRTRDQHLLPYEGDLFEALFASGDTVALSDLKGSFAENLHKSQRQLYADMVAQGWYARSPAQTRILGRWLGVGALLVSAVVTVILALTTQVALIGVGLIIASIALLLSARWLPARTGRGSAARERVLGFRLYIATAEAEQIAFGERVNIFSEFLAYAMVFGLVDRWARILDGLDAQALRQLDWYSGANAFTIGAFVGSFGSFSTMAAGTVATAAATPGTSGGTGFGSSGFSGGGFGGGGGGSW
jgi:hypothetical protein